MQHKPPCRILLSWYMALLLPLLGASLLICTILVPLLPQGVAKLLLSVWYGFILFFLGIYLPLRRHTLRFSLSKEGVTRSGGVLFSTRQRIPLGAVRHVTLLQGPVERLYGITYLLVSAAGGHILVEGLAASQASIWCRKLLPDG